MLTNSTLQRTKAKIEFTGSQYVVDEVVGGTTSPWPIVEHVTLAQRRATQIDSVPTSDFGHITENF
jgi:hypothetical protein